MTDKLTGTNCSIKEQSQLAHFTRTLIKMKMGRKYASMLRSNLVDNPFEINEIEKILLDKVVQCELDLFLQRHIPVPKVHGKLKQPSWARHINDELNESWAQYEEGLICWDEFLTCYVFHFSEKFREQLSKWDMGAPRNLFV